MADYESPSVVRQQVELDQIIAMSGKAKVRVSADTTGSTEETWVESDFGGNYNIAL